MKILSLIMDYIPIINEIFIATFYFFVYIGIIIHN